MNDSIDCLLLNLFISCSRNNLLSFFKNFLHDSFVVSICFIIRSERKLLLNCLLLIFMPFFISFTIFFKSSSLKVIIFFVLNDWSISINVLGFRWCLSINLWVFNNIFWYFDWGSLVEFIIDLLLCKETLESNWVFILNNKWIDSIDFLVFL